MNQLVSKLIWYDLLYLLLAQVPFIFLFTYGHLPDWLCHMESILVPSILVGFLAIVDSISIVRFLFIFYTKNPTANQDDFWSRFLFSWSFFLSIIFNMAWYILPGKSPHFFYICSGSAPESFFHAPTKVNYLLLFKAGSSLIINLAVYMKCKMFERNDANRSATLNGGPFGRGNLPSATFCLAVVWLIFSFVNYFGKMNSTDLESITKYPGYIWFQILNLSSVPVATFFFIVVFFVRDKNLRIFIYKELLSFIRAHCQDDFISIFDD